MAGKGRRDGATIVVKKYEEGGHGHHGGAWKVAYADFVTAMMAFFLLMWLLNATSEEQRRGLADYFAPTNVLGRSTSGSGAPFGGNTPNAPGEMSTDTTVLRVERGPAPTRIDLDEEEEAEQAPQSGPGAPTDHPIPGEVGQGSQESRTAPGGPGSTEGNLGGSRAEGITDAEFRAEAARREAAAFEQAAEELRAAIRDDPALADLARQLRIEQVPEGLRIQLLDADRQPMFPVGGATPNERARGLIQKVAQVAARLPNALAISGHTDATPFRGGERSNWELSAERANAVRRLLVEGGIGEARLRSVTGNADRDPLIPDQPQAAANRRVAITLLRAAPLTAPPGAP
ncbi:OmpA family protein [Siccirubricoccus sp. KC 17139]|uniref:OmpA family protein n=1 Tax=Siccirubricoccus soli TaxID=2899147 RepID=A0ABT1CYX8_9PROT|nr:flagellar motor protein MotB [Siccirubricoccus soli]MCO6414873.1 OmpA family protein [Siccirubricoccus soli]MCP2681003.1 OmpA family protein [Siccirubricoccus soli]